MKRRVVSVLLVLSLVLALMPMGVFAASSGTCGDNLTWTLDDAGTLTISGSGDMTDWSSSNSIPWYSNRSNIKAVIIEDGVTSIGNWTFEYCTSLTSVEIPNSVTSIGGNAFSECSSLTSVEIPNSVTSIGVRAFSRCESLTSVTIPNKITSIDGTFWGCKNLTNVIIPRSVTIIGDYAFSYCEKLTGEIIPNWITGIGMCAFFGCTGLTNVTIPNSVTGIGSSTFDGCSSLTSVEIPNSVTSIGECAFRDCSSLTSVDIPNSVTSIGHSAFSWCSSLTSVTIPNSVTSIGISAFYGCESLTSVTIPNSVTSIGISAFYGCSSLTSITVESGNNNYLSENGVLFNKNKTELICCPGGKIGAYTIPNNVTSIGSYAFSYCTSLTSVTIPDSVTSIGDGAFYGCESLTSVVIPNSVTSVGGSAFVGCSSLTSVTIGNSVTSVGGSAFQGCSSLTSVTIPNNVTSIENYTFYKCSSLTSVIIGDNVTRIGNYAFEGCSLTSVTIGNSVTSIGNRAFGFCERLISVVIPNSVTSIESWAFYGCESLTSVTIGNSVTSVGSSAFRFCSSLISVAIPNSVTSIGNNAFYGCSSLTDVYYTGTQEEWKKISKGSNNSPLTRATIHYKQGAPDPTSGKVRVTGIKINAPQGTTIRVGDSIQLNAIVSPANATNKTVHWLCYDIDDIISIDQSGKLTGIRAGKTAVRVLSDIYTPYDTVEITVVPKEIGFYGSYEYSFDNSWNSFGYYKGIDVGPWNFGGYGIPKERYLQVGLSESEADALVSLWGGNCFGMSLSSILFYENILKPERYKASVHYPFDFDAPKSDSTEDTKLREMIELFQVSQKMPEAKCYSFSGQRIIQELDKGHPVVLLVTSSEGDHAVVIRGYYKSGASYEFDIYDCSLLIGTLDYTNDNDWKINYTSNGLSCDYTPCAYMTVDQIKYVYQTIKNKNAHNAMSLMSFEPTYTYFFTEAVDLRLENAAGQVSTIDESVLSGEMENTRLIPSGILAETPSYTILAPSDTYCFTGIDQLSAANNDIAISIQAAGPITASADLRTITVGAGDYSITYTTYGNDYDTMILSGTATAPVTCVLGENQATVSGAETLTATATVSETQVDMTVTDTDGVKVASFGSALPAHEKTPVPQYDLASGAYEEGQTLTFTKDDDTVVYYRIDDGEETIYSLPLTIDRSMTVTAYAKKYGYDNSETVTLNYTLPEIEAPSPSVAVGEYDTVQYVDLLNGDYEADIYYTTDGEDPKVDGLLFGSSIVLTEDTTIKAYAVKDGCASDVVALQYQIDASDDFMLLNTPTNQDGEFLTSDNVSHTTAVKLAIQKFTEASKEGKFVVAFYQKNGQLLTLGMQEATIDKDTDSISVPVNVSPEGAASMKIFMLSDGFQAAGNVVELQFGD